MIRIASKFSGAVIVGTRDLQVLDKLDAVLDVRSVYDPGRDRYDHHQKGFEESHPSAIRLFDKKFPHFNALVEIYATDRANGNDAMAPGDAEDQVEAGVECSQQFVTPDDEMDDSSVIGDEPQISTGIR